MRVIPVLDLRAGQAVHAIAGDRAHYGPVRSILHPGSDPIDLARAYRDILGLRDLYLADLDAIAGGPPNLRLYRELHALGLTLWVDAGVRDSSGLCPLRDSGVATLIIGLETLSGTAALVEIVESTDPGSLVFSLDLRAGRPLVAAGSDWRASDPLGLAEEALGLGVRRVLLLDLARVGTGRGIGTIPLLSALAKGHPGVELTVGGGVGGRDDLPPLARAGASAVLIGSALHDGGIARSDIDPGQRAGSS